MDTKRVDPKTLEIHPLNEALIPPMTPEEFEALRESIREHGIKHPVQVLKGTNQVLDGRHRLRAALDLGLSEIPIVEVEIQEELVGTYVIRTVAEHRHLTVAQKAALAAEYIEMRLKTKLCEFENKGAKNCTFVKTDTNRSLDTGKLREEAARHLGVNHQYVQIAWNLKRLVPESFQLLKAGELSIQEAQQVVAQARLELGDGKLIPELRKLFDLGKFKPEAAWHIALLPEEDQRTLLEVLGIRAIEKLTASESKKLKLVFKNPEDTKEFKKLQEELETIRTERDALREEVAEAQQRITAYEQELVELEARVREAASEVSPEVAARISFLEDELARLKEEREEYEARIAELEELREEARKFYLNYIREKELREEMEKKLKDFQDRMRKASRMVHKMLTRRWGRKKKTQYERIIQALQNREAKLRQKYENVLKEREQLEKVISFLERKIVHLQARREHLSTMKALRLLIGVLSSPDLKRLPDDIRAGEGDIGAALDLFAKVLDLTDKLAADVAGAVKDLYTALRIIKEEQEKKGNRNAPGA